jgi:hypothetical protein
MSVGENGATHPGTNAQIEMTAMISTGTSTASGILRGNRGWNFDPALGSVSA